MNWSEIIYYGFRIVKWRFGDKSPIIASVKLTYRCNLNCIHCGWKNLPFTKELSVDKWKEILKDIYNAGVRILVLEGGEPTLRKDLAEIILIAKDIGFRVVLVTNGTNSLALYEPDLIMCSIDGPKDIHESIRGKFAYSNLIRNLQSCKIRKMALTTINKKNFSYIKEILSVYESYVDLFGFNIMYSLNNATNELILSENEVEYVYSIISSLSGQYNIVNTENMINSIEWKCKPWILLLSEPDGSWKHQKYCFIDYLSERHDCTKCQLACYRGLSLLAQGDINTWYLVNNYLFS